MKVYINPYNNGSKSVKELKTVRPDWKVPRTLGRNLTGAIVNWGSSAPLPARIAANCIIFNDPENVSIWSDKRNMCHYINNELEEEERSLFIEQTVDHDVAQQWADDGYTVVVRQLARASCGRGIVIVEPDDEVPSGQVFTKYQKKKHEYRVHVGLCVEPNAYEVPVVAKVLCVQRKAKKRGVEYADTRIRNAHSENDIGWVFLSTAIEDVPAAVLETAKEALKVSGLDFAGADVIYNERLNRAWVVELNTAPGIGATDAQAYVSYFEGELI